MSQPVKSQAVEISFDCLPLRSVARFDVPLDATAEMEAKVARIRAAAEKHGMHNAYYLHNAKCVYRLSNSQDVGMLEFSFEGAVLTDEGDRKTLLCDLDAVLERDTCEWINEPIVRWFAETIRQAVRVEFDRYISSGDLRRTIERLEKLAAQSDARGGFLGMGL